MINEGLNTALMIYLFVGVVYYLVRTAITSKDDSINLNIKTRLDLVMIILFPLQAALIIVVDKIVTQSAKFAVWLGEDR